MKARSNAEQEEKNIPSRGWRRRGRRSGTRTSDNRGGWQPGPKTKTKAGS